MADKADFKFPFRPTAYPHPVKELAQAMHMN